MLGSVTVEKEKLKIFEFSQVCIKTCSSFSLVKYIPRKAPAPVIPITIENVEYIVPEGTLQQLITGIKQC